MGIQKILSFLVFVSLAVSLLLPASNEIGKVLSLFTIMAILYPIVRSIKSVDYHITLLFVFMLGYVFVPFNYYWFGLHVNFYQECETPSTVYTTLQVLCLFHSVLLYKIRFSKDNCVRKEILCDNNDLIYKLLVTISFIFVMFGSTGQSIFEAGGYEGARAARYSSSFFAYAIIPISMSYIYANTKIKKCISYFLVFFFCTKDLAFGGRVDSIELLLIIFFIHFQYTWSRKTILSTAVVGVLFFSAWGVLRNDVNLGFWSALSSLSPFLSNGVAQTADFQTGNAAEVYYSSVRIMYMIEHEILTLGLRMGAALYFFISMVVPYSLLPDFANLSTFMQITYWSGGGGLGPIFFYAFGSWLGVFVFSLFISKCMNLYLSSSSKYIHYYTILLFATTPRWYAYYPIQIFKFCVIGALLYYTMNYFFRKKS